MNARMPCAALAALVWCALAPPAVAASPEETCLLGSDSDDAQYRDLLPYRRSASATGVVKGTLAEATAEAGVPPPAMLEALRAFATAIDLERDLRDGDGFYVRYERTFTVDGTPIGVGRVLWAELRTQAKGTLAIHRFRAIKADSDPFYLASGQDTEPTLLQMPLASTSVTSGFGLRADPFDQPYARNLAMGPLIDPKKLDRGKPVPGSNLKPSPLTNPSQSVPVNVPTALGLTMGLSPVNARPTTGFGRVAMFMHEGVDLLAAPGTMIYAAADGVVKGAEPKGRYGNWIEIEHAGKLTTVYGHLSAFAPGIAPGVEVRQGEVIGFTGSTGRTTGPHLHFEILHNGRPTNPIGNPATRHGQLRGADLDRFRKIVARNLAEREREPKSM